MIMDKIYEEDGGVTQVGNVASGQKIDIFGKKDKNMDNWYDQLFELNDYKIENNTSSMDRTLFSGNVGGLISSFEENINSKFFSSSDKELYNKLCDELKLYPREKNVSIIQTSTGIKFIFNLDM